MSGSMSFDEFQEMWAGLVVWKDHFMICDRNRSGTIDSLELNQALFSLGYRFGPHTMNCIMQRFSFNGSILFDDYVACCVKLTNFTYHFQLRMQNLQGIAAYEYEDFIQCIMKI